jgi:nitroreductase
MDSTDNRNAIIEREGTMNEVMKAIKARRSVRSYETTAVPRDLLQAVIEAGNEAPSAMNSQPLN